MATPERATAAPLVAGANAEADEAAAANTAALHNRRILNNIFERKVTEEYWKAIAAYVVG
jgi:hypothetical protein